VQWCDGTLLAVTDLVRLDVVSSGNQIAQQLCAPQRLRSTQALLPLACMARDMYKAHLHSKHLRSLLCLLIVLTVLAL
jgi:hypothetical protein